MPSRSSQFPVHERDYTLGMNEQPILLDGMEVFFDKTYGLYPVALVGDQPTPAPGAKSDPSGNGSRGRA